MRGEMVESGGKAAQIERLNCVLDGLNIPIYISDISTNRILYASARLRWMRSGRQLIDRICWEVLQDRNKRCEACPVIYLLKNPGKDYRWMLDIEGRRFLVCDNIITWSKGKMVHMQFMVDIAE